jgi:hypothetical protein
MSNQEDNKFKRPPWYHFLARRDYDTTLKTAMMTVSELKARILPKDIAEEYDVDIPPTWTEQPALYLLRGLGYPKGLPPGTGVGLVQSPYADIYTKIYGVNPIADLPKYRKMYRVHPDIQQAVQMQVGLAIGKGFTLGHKDEDVIEYINKISNRIDLPQHMLVMATDCLVYGNSFTEIQWDKSVTTKERMYEYKGEDYSLEDLKRANISPSLAKPAKVKDGNIEKEFIAEKVVKDPEAKTIVALKDLDPLYMRVRRDSYGNIFGYIQWMAFPPVLINSESCIHIRYRPASWGYESAYGTSILMPLIKNTDLLNQFENDAATWIHSRAVPPLIVKGGTPEKPYSTDQMTALMGILKARTAATMIFTKGDVAFEEMKTIASQLNVDWWIKYLLLRRYQALGVPPIMMGMTERGSKGTAEVLLHDFVTRLQVLQEFISDPVEEYIFKPLIKAEFGKDVENAEIIWKPIIEEDKNMRSQRLIQMVQVGAISVNDLREEMGFRRITKESQKDVDEFDKLVPKEPPTMAQGFPPKRPAGPPPGGPKPPESTPTPPESHQKLEQDIRTKKIQLLQIEDSFREKMLGLVKKTKFDLRDDAKLVKNVKHEARLEAKDIINEGVVASYLVGRFKANDALGQFDDFSLKQEDLKSLSSLKSKFLSDYDKVFEEMVKMKEEGILE